MRFPKLVVLIALLSGVAAAETFDVVTYTAPTGWTKTATGDAVQLSISDPKTSEYALAVILRSAPTRASADESFNAVWAKGVQGTVKVGAPAKQPAVVKNGWTLVSGGAQFTTDATKGVALVIAATGYGKTTSLIVMTNTARYQPGIEALVGSLDIAGSTPATPARLDRAAIVGKIWENATAQRSTTTGYSSGGFYVTTYRFTADGKYSYTWIGADSTIQNNSLVRETGTYTLDGDQLAIAPTAGTTEEWTVVGGPFDHNTPYARIREIKEHWGSLVKKTASKRAALRYTVAIKPATSQGVGLNLTPTSGGELFLIETDPAKAHVIPKE